MGQKFGGKKINLQEKQQQIINEINSETPKIWSTAKMINTEKTSNGKDDFLKPEVNSKNKIPYLKQEKHAQKTRSSQNKITRLREKIRKA